MHKSLSLCQSPSTCQTHEHKSSLGLETERQSVVSLASSLSRSGDEACKQRVCRGSSQPLPSVSSLRGILQSCAQRGPKWPFWGQKWPNMAGLPMSQSGLRGPKMIPNDQYNMFLTIWGHFGIIWTLFDHFTQNLNFCPHRARKLTFTP